MLAELVNDGGCVTVRVATLLVTVPGAALLTTHWNLSPFMPAVASVIVSVAVAAPL